MITNISQFKSYIYMFIYIINVSRVLIITKLYDYLNKLSIIYFLPIDYFNLNFVSIKSTS